MRGARGLLGAHITDAHAHIDWDDALPEYRQQREFCTARIRNKYFLGGVGTGKTTALCDGNMLAALSTPRRWAKAGVMHALFGRTGRDLRDVILPKFEERLQELEDNTGLRLYKGWRVSDKELTWANGAKTVFRPYNKPDKYRGLNLCTAWMDELEFGEGDPLKALTVIQTRIREGPPWLRTLGVASSPNGAWSPGVKLWKRRQDRNSRKWRIWHATMFDNPYLFELEDLCPMCNDLAPRCGREEGCGGLGLHSEYIETTRSSMSRRQWLQEGLGQLVGSRGGIYADDYSEDRNVVPWVWDPRLPWVLAIDWGESHAYFCAIQVCDRPVLIPETREVLMPGTWVVAAERKMEDTTRPRFRHAIERFIKHGDLGGRKLRTSGRGPGLPVWVATDRAVKYENRWIYNWLDGPKTTVTYCKTRKQYERMHGIGMVSYMLNPLEGKPRLLLASTLPPPGEEPVGLRESLQQYGFLLDRTGQPTGVPESNTIHTHPCDALRYAIVTAAHREDLHGGTVLPFVEYRSVRDDDDYDWMEDDYVFGQSVAA